ncbi:hypothetical protein KIPB_009094, partial [Kipferlia bialata]|eukprot:g9094.t1
MTVLPGTHDRAAKEYLSQYNYQDAISHLQYSGNVKLLADVYFHTEDYTSLRGLITHTHETDNDVLMHIAHNLTRAGDVDGASKAYIAANHPQRAVNVAMAMCSFDIAYRIATEYGLVDTVTEPLSVYIKQLVDNKDYSTAVDVLIRSGRDQEASALLYSMGKEALLSAVSMPTGSDGTVARLRQCSKVFVLCYQSAKRAMIRQSQTAAPSTDLLDDVLAEEENNDHDTTSLSHMLGMPTSLVSTSLVKSILVAIRMTLLAHECVRTGKYKQALRVGVPILFPEGVENHIEDEHELDLGTLLGSTDREDSPLTGDVIGPLAVRYAAPAVAYAALQSGLGWLASETFI